MSVKHLARVSLRLFTTIVALGALAVVAALTVLPFPTAETTAPPLAPAAPVPDAASDAASDTAADTAAEIDASDVQPAASALRVALFMPFEGGGRTGLILPRNHTPALLGGFAWDLHKGPGAAVRANMSSPDGTIALKVARIQSNSNGAGQRVLLDVRVGGTLVGQIQYGHLANLQVSTSTPSFAPGTLLGYMPTGTRPYSGCADGTSDGWPYSTAWRVCTTSGIHTHTDFQRACWASFPTYEVQAADTPIGMMSTALPVANNAQCNATELREVASPPARDGDFITGAGNTWRMAGGAPIWVSSWDPFGGRQNYTAYSDARFAALAQYPADGTWLRGLPSQRLFRVAGGAPILSNDMAPTGTVIGVDDAAIDQISTAAPRNRLRLTPTDGTYLQGSGTKRIFSVAGGAPLYISTLAPWGSEGIRYVTVGDQAIDNAGGTGAWGRLRTVPADGTFLIGKSSGGVFRVAGGSPQWVDSWAPFGGTQAAVQVDDAAIERAGSGGDWNRLREFPLDGTVLRTAADKRLYRVAGGAPLHLTSDSVLEADAPSPVDVSATVIDNASRNDRNHAHLRQLPADNTFVRNPSGWVYIFAGGAPIWVSGWAPYGGAQATVRVDAAALTQAGNAAQPWGGHVAASPADGTFVRILETNAYARAAGGALLPLRSCELLSGCAGAVDVTTGGVAEYTSANPRPANGTVLRFLPSGTIYRVDGTRCIEQTSAAGAISVNDGDHPCLRETPSAPAQPTVAAGDRSATVTWTPPASDGGRDISAYTVLARATGQTTVQTAAAGDATQTVVAGLQNGVAYTFEVRAVNDVGTGASSPPSPAIVPAGVPQGVAIDGVTASAADVTVTWSRAHPNGAAVQQYVVTATGPAGTRTATVSGSLTRATLAGMGVGTYAVTVAAVNSVGRSAASRPRNVTVSAAPPSSPPSVQARVSGTSVTVTWSSPVPNGAAITGYRVEVGSQIVEVGTDLRSATLAGVARGTHTVRVSAINAAGRGEATTSSVSVP